MKKGGDVVGITHPKIGGDIQFLIPFSIESVLKVREKQNCHSELVSESSIDATLRDFHFRACVKSMFSRHFHESGNLKIQYIREIRDSRVRACVKTHFCLSFPRKWKSQNPVSMRLYEIPACTGTKESPLISDFSHRLYQERVRGYVLNCLN
jgi:hypothetical protein